jgi:hypothetical protein
VRKLWQLCGVWQVDGDGISEADGILERLGVCNYHFNHDQNNLHDLGFKRKKEQVKVCFVEDVYIAENFFISSHEVQDVRNILGK